MATILVVDDRPVNREFLVTLLGYRNHRLLEASDGVEALALVRAERPDLVITDVLMPTMDGYEFVHQLRADPAIASTAVIFFTAHYHKQEAQLLAKTCGVAHILTKPCEPEVILRAVEKSLGAPMQITAPWTPQDFDHEHLRVITDKLSETIDDLGAANLKMRTLIDMSLQLASERDPRQLMKDVCRAARDLLGARYALLAVGSRDEGTVAFRVTSGMDAATIASLSRISLLQGTVGLAFTQRKAGRWSGLDGDPQEFGLPAGHPPVNSLLVAPIVSLVHVYGWLCLTNKVGATEFSEDDERLLTILAAQVGRIYESGNLYQEVRKHAGKLETEITQRKLAQEKVERLNRVYAVLSGINTLIVRARDRQYLFDEACRIAVEHGGFGIAWIDLLDRKTFEITPVAWAGDDAQSLTRAPHTVKPDTPRGQGLSGRAIHTKQPVFDNDIAASPGVGGERRKEMIRRGYRSGIVLPLLFDGEVTASLSLFTREAGFFDENELRLLNELAGDISFALEHIGKEEKIARLSRIQAVMGRINALIVRVRDRQTLFNETCDIAVRYGGFGIAWIGALNRDTMEVTPSACAGVEADSFLAHSQNTTRSDTPMGQGLVGRAIREKRAVFSNDIAIEVGLGGERRKEALRRGYRSAISLPLLVEGAVVGNLSLFAKEANFFTADELALLEELSGDISFALAHIESEGQIARLSRIRAVTSGIDSVIVRVRDRQKLFKQACDIIVANGQFPFAWIGALDPATQDVTPVAWAGVNAEALTQAKSSARADSPRGEGAVGRAIRERRPVFVNAITSENLGGARLREILAAGFRSQITLPLYEDETVVGTLTMYAREPYFFDEEEVRLLSGLAGDISFALENISRQQKLDKLSRIRAVSAEINAAIVRIGERETLLQETCRIAAETGKIDLVWIALIDPDAREIKPVAWAGFSDQAAHAVSWATIQSVQGTLGIVVETKRPAVVNDIGTGLQGGMLRQEAVKKGCFSTVALPIIVNDEVVAIIALFAPGRGFFDRDELALLDEVAADVSFALQSITQKEKINHLAYYDVLTGLPNRALLTDRLNQELHGAKRDGGKVAVLMLCVKRFHHINETLGRQGGDAILRELAQRLQRIWRESDHVARIGGDGFAAIFSNIREASEIAHVFERALADSFELPFAIDGKEFRISIVAGIAIYPADGEDADSLLRNAEAALKKTKLAGERYLFYEPRMNATVAASLILENKLRQALDREQFVLHYQPKVEFGSGRIAGVEALIRWDDPETGLVPPANFIPLLEETGMILDVGRWAIRQALEDYSNWARLGLLLPRVAVNVSPIQLRQRNFTEMVSNAIAESKAVLHGLDLEITESLIMEDIEGNIGKLKALRDMGVTIAIDDFGTGYSSLAYLARLPVNALKIDRSFISTMTDDPDSKTIVSMIISLAHSLRLKVIAEGVETEGQSQTLMLLKCDEMQGFFYSKPVPAEQLIKLLGIG